MDLSWSGATSSNVDIYRNGAVIVTTAAMMVSTPIESVAMGLPPSRIKCATQAVRPVQIKRQ